MASQDTPALPPSATEGRAKRERKSVDFFEPSEIKHVEELVILQGKGTKLADIPNVAFRLSKLKGTDDLLEDLHMLLYKRKGKSHTRKREIGQFSGFSYAEGKEGEEQQRLEERLNRWTLEHVHKLMELLDMPRGSGDKVRAIRRFMDEAAKTQRVLAFLEKPEKLSAADLASKEAKKKAAKKRKAQTKKGAASKRMKQPGKPKKAEHEGEDDSDQDSDEDGDESDDEEEEVQPAKRRTPSKKQPNTPAKRAKSATKQENAVDGVDNLQLQAAVASILEGKDVATFSNKDLLQELAKRFPDVDLAPHKRLVKQLAVTWITNNPPSSAEPAATAAKAEERAQEGVETEEPTQAIANGCALEDVAAEQHTGVKPSAMQVGMSKPHEEHAANENAGVQTH